MLLVGADVVHLASCLLQHGPEHLRHILKGVEDWMREREYASVNQMKGSLSQKCQSSPDAYTRASYIRVLDSYTPASGVWL